MHNYVKGHCESSDHQKKFGWVPILLSLLSIHPSLITNQLPHTKFLLICISVFLYMMNLTNPQQQFKILRTLLLTIRMFVIMSSGHKK